ncbi:hypothetical protein [Portibacter marinus]|uniref:hypothetical protein n=1 Tax=Portibacter marinus TaxID=2898660 RepID=UPI001F33882E|nr:hypothetical protein [Portibacter marinus]
MSAINSTYHADVVLGFREIPEKNYSRQIYFIEKHRDIVENMDTDFRIDLLDKYNNALFEIGHYRKCLDHIDLLIFDVMSENFIRTEEDLFCTLLKRKSYALFNVGEYQKAQYVASELMKIKPDIQEPNLIMTNCGYRIIKEKTRSLRAFAIMLLIFGVTITCFDLLVIQNFYPEQMVKMGWLRGITIGGAALLIIALEVYAFLSGRKGARKVLQESLMKRSQV